MIKKFVSHNYKIYVGDYPLIPNNETTNPEITGLGHEPRLFGVRVQLDCIPNNTTNPKHFFDAAQNIQNDVYSNNMDVVRYFKPENVICVKNCCEVEHCGMKPITEHPKYEQWKNELDAGEFVSLFGFDWVK